MTRPIAAAAAATEYFEKSGRFQSHADIRLSDGFSPQTRIHFQTAAVTTTIRNYSLRDVVFDTDRLMLIQDGFAVPETAPFLPVDQIAQPQIDPATLIRIETDDDFIVGYNTGHHAYRFWVTQCLPAIDWSLRKQRTRSPKLILPRLEPWQEDFLRIAGYDKVPRLTPAPGAKYLLPRVEYSEFLNLSATQAICLSARTTAKRLLDALPPPATAEPVLYVPCSNPYYGGIENEAAVIDLLRGHGVYILDQQRLGTAARLNLFRHADVIIGPIGQSLTDVLFCKPGALVWEWMPDHNQHAAFNRLAQSAGADYWGDVFNSGLSPGQSGPWQVDLALVKQRLSWISARFAAGTTRRPPLQIATQDEAAPEAADDDDAAGMPSDKLAMLFESLGDNCEFGLVQRSAGAEPLGLLRFAGLFIAIEDRLEALTAALVRKFEGLGASGTVDVYLDGEPGRREYLVRESAYRLMYHTGVAETEAELEQVQARETKRLNFLRRKLLNDLESGEKIWVWKSAATSVARDVRPLLDVLRSLGPNKLLWVVEANEWHNPGSVEQLDHDFFKGYVERFAPYDNAPDIRPGSWLALCRATYALCRRAPSPAEPADEPAAKPALSAMQFLAANQAGVTNCPAENAAAPAKKKPSRLAWLFSRF